MANHFLIATGSKPRVPPGIEVDGEHIVTSDHLEDLKEFPKSMVILGGGVVGCEYATIFANYRKTAISIIDHQPRILPFEDEDISATISRSFARMGITIHREPKLTSMRVVEGEVAYVLQTSSGESEPHRAERALISTGRVPNTAALNLAVTGMRLDDHGGIVIDQTRSSVSHSYAAGDSSAEAMNGSVIASCVSARRPSRDKARSRVAI